MGLSSSQGRLGPGELVRPDSWGDPARAVPAPRGGIPTLRGHAPALEACCASLVRPAGGSIAQPGTSRERGDAGLGPGTWDLGLWGWSPTLPPRGAGWWAGWDAVSEVMGPG